MGTRWCEEGRCGRFKTAIESGLVALLYQHLEDGGRRSGVQGQAWAACLQNAKDKKT